MKHQDKLAEYIKKEIDSISYESEVDEMWEAFQTSNTEKLNPTNQSKYFLLLLLFLISLAGFFFLKNNNASTNSSAIVNQISTHAEDSSMSTKHESNTRLDKQKNISNKNSGESISQNENSKKLTLTDKTEVIDNNTITKSNSNSNKHSINQNTSNLHTSSELFAFGEFSKKQGSTFLSDDASFNQNELLNQTFTPSTSNNLEQIFESNKKVQEVDDANLTREQISILNPLFSETNGLQLIDFEGNRLNRIERCKIKNKRPQYFRAAFSASNNQILRSAFEYGRVHKTCNTRGWKYGVGFGIDDGYSLSQDSLVFLNGIVIQEIRKDKDLDFLIQSFIAGEYFFNKNNWTVGLGGKINFAVLNRFRTFDETTYIQPILGGSAIAGSEGVLINHWNGINRFGFDGILNVSYRINNLEFGLNASKRLNSLIKKERAQRNKNNLPIQFGAHISKYF